MIYLNKQVLNKDINNFSTMNNKWMFNLQMIKRKMTFMKNMTLIYYKIKIYKN